MKIRTRMSGGERLKYFLSSVAMIVIGYLVTQNAETDAAQTLAGIAILLGAVGIFGSILGLQDRKL